MSTSSSRKAKKQRTPKKKSGPKKEDDDVNNLVDEIKDLNVDPDRQIVPMFKMDFALPYIIHDYKEDMDNICTVDVLCCTYPKEYYIPDVIKGGLALQLRVRVPSFFTNESRILNANGGDGFNRNTHQAQAYKEQCEAIDQHYGFVNTIFGDNPQVIPLPFKVEERIVGWEVQAQLNNLGTLTDDLGGQQFHFTLSINLMKLKTKRRTTGGFRIIGGEDNMEEEL